MSEEIYSVVTPFPDVASLAQGYMNRADGERLLLPLPVACNEGTGLRFVVYLSDGTPAFAGAGLCAQTSDQGSTVPPDRRFETLLDSLQFDERSRPVYDYIVAVRNAAYAQPASADEAVPTDVDVVDLEAFANDGVHDDEPTQYTGAPSRSAEKAARVSVPSPEVETYEIDAADDVAATSTEPPSAFAPLQPSLRPSAASPERFASFIPPPIPTGLLTRPARATHWQPSAPRRPTPRPSTGLFRYVTGGLPRPSHPPRPELDAALQVTPAPRP